MPQPPRLAPASSSIPPASLRALIDAAPEGVVVFDSRSTVLLCNRAAMRLLACEPGFTLSQLEPVLGPQLMAWLLMERSGVPQPLPAPPQRLADGRGVRAGFQTLDFGQWALRLEPLKEAPSTLSAPGIDAVGMPAPAARELLRLFWDSPFPATVQDEHFKLVEVNQAYVDFTGYAREQLIGLDPLQLQPEEDRQRSFDFRAQQQLPGEQEGTLKTQSDRRLIDAAGRERWFRLARCALAGSAGRTLWLSVLHDITAERVAREQADRSVRELDQWFDLSPVGMVLFDDTGLLLRSNPAFASLAGEVPLLLPEALPAMRHLLGWDGDAPSADISPDLPPLERRSSLALPDGRRLRLRALVRGFETVAGQRRYMAVVEDRTLEEERELAQLEIGALMDTASVGIATFEESRGWVRSAQGKSSSGTGTPGLQSISSEIVEPESMPEYERLQRALKQGERTEVRYAVRHPDLGPRWLSTRVEPGQLGSGRRTLSVVTQDVTEKEQARLRNEQLLRELELMFNLSEVGIAYLRGGRLERANQALAAMTGYAPAELRGLEHVELFEDRAAYLEYRRIEDQVLRQQGRFTTERRLRRRDGTVLWVQVSKRAVDESDPEAGAICSYVNVDERHRARQSLVLQAERTRAILDSVLVGIVTVGEHGIEWMNRSARRMFAGELADFVGEPIATVATSEPDHPLRRTHYLHALAEGEAEAFECRLVGRDGREFWVVGNAVVTGRESSGRQLTFALLDIERRRQAEISIAQTQASLQRIIETAPLAIGLLDARSLRMIQVNQMAAMVAGRTVNEALGRMPEELFEPEVAQRLTHDLRLALARNEVLRAEYRLGVRGELRVLDARFVPLASTSAGEHAAEQVLFVASDVTEQRAAEQARYEAAIAQREMLVKEVHHRIKNNLQGVAGLLQQTAQRRPEVAGVIAEAVSQVHAIAQVYGLQVGAVGPLRIKSVLEAIVASVQRMFGRTIAIAVQGEAPQRWALPEAESIPIALTINELLTNAVKHSSPDADILCTLMCGDNEVIVSIANRGQLPEGFSVAQIPGGVSGLGLVRALLPRRSATLSIATEGDEVVTRVTLVPPGITSLEPP